MSKKKSVSDGEKFKKSLIKVADEVDKLPQDVTKADYANSESKETLSEWELRKLGGFPALKNMYFPPERNIVVESGSKLMRAHRNKIESTFGKEIYLAEEIKAVLKEVLEKNPIKLHPPVKAAKTSRKPTERTVVVHLSDLHYGSNVSAQEMDDVNEFNWQIAARRTAYLMEQVVTYKPQYREKTDLVMCINGDIIAGVIHNQEWFADLLTTQFAGTLSILSQAVTYAAAHFNKVRVFCTPGNHGRAMHKSSTDRATVHKWDSYENMIYVALKEVVQAKHKNVEVIIPEAPYAVIDVLGHKLLQTHGDTVLNVGNPGKNIDMKGINDQINKINANLLSGDENFAAVLVGHVHTPTVQLTESGTVLLINGCLIGTDQYAQSLGIFGNYPTQMLFEVTKKYAVGDMRMIQVKEGDTKEELDKIIEPFKGKF